MPDQFISSMTHHLNQEITLVLSKKTSRAFEQIEATYPVYLKKVTKHDTSIEISCVPVGSSVKQAFLTVRIPITAHFIQKQDNSWRIHYEEDSFTRIVTLVFPKPQYQPSRDITSSKPSKPLIKEFKNAHGKVERIYVETHAPEVTLSYLKKVQELLEKLLRHWYSVTITSNNTELSRLSIFKKMELLLIPGNPLFEATFLSDEEEFITEIPASFKIDLVKNEISFTVDRDSITIRKK
ncbi:MAG: hypothetical protein QY312_00380 [Candidatus Dojkabacteria bacterium]|nr:MAG: hypothetical protein QY312_00380 [Candidatus Dojkabacteria bacterium]